MSDNLEPTISPIKKQVFLITFTFKRENAYAIQLLFVLILSYICPNLVLYRACFDTNASGFLARECPHLWVSLATGGAMKASVLLSGIHKHMPALFSELVSAFCANDFAFVMCFQANGAQVGARCV